MTKIIETRQVEAFQDAEEPIEIGQWYWFKDHKNVWVPNPDYNPNLESEDSDDDENNSLGEYQKVAVEVLGCVMHIGSNFVRLKGRVPYDDCEWETDVHFDVFDQDCRRELNPERVVQQQINYYEEAVQQNLEEVQKVMQRLGCASQQKLTRQNADESTVAMNTLSLHVGDVKEYERALIEAKENELPTLFKEIKDNNQRLADWMLLKTLPVKAQSWGLKRNVQQIEDRVFSVSLYAGLAENVVQVRKGKPAAIHEPLHVMQNRLYMDEECIAGYTHGGICCERIEDFDRWLSRPENYKQILPHERTLVSFRVRRYRKERSCRDLVDLLVRIQLEECDKWTYLYIRNGDQLFRLDTEIEFGRQLFPDKHEFDVTGKCWIAVSRDGGVSGIIPDRQYRDRMETIAKNEEAEAAEVVLAKQWTKDNPEKSWVYNPHNKWSGRNTDPWGCTYEPFDQSSVYYDAASEKISRDIRDYNRICLLLQGLLDRSPVLHPHPPAKLWEPDSFNSIIRLVYDKDRTLYDGDAPDYEAYLRDSQKTIRKGSVTIGQQAFWLKVEADKENSRRENDYRRDWIELKEFAPPGNPGPGNLAVVESVRAGKAKFVWYRNRRRVERWSNQSYGDLLKTSISVPVESLLNVDAYKLGDFRQFYSDPRTRSKYMQWAGTLLMAEEYHAGNLDLKTDEPVYSEESKIKRRARRKNRKRK